MFTLLAFVFLGIFCLADGAKILGVFQMPSYSHYQMSDKLMKELAVRGHDVTVITRFEEKKKEKNFKTVVLTDELDTYKGVKILILNMAKRNIFENIFHSDVAYFAFTENTLNNTNVQSLLKSNEKFDIVIIERLLNNALLGFCYHYQAHCVIFSPQIISRWTNVQMGNAGSPSYVQDPRSRFSSKMNFFERICNSLAYLFAEILFYAHVLPRHNYIMHKYFPGSPPITDIFHNISLMLVNSHISTNPALPLLPNMIEIGGFHIPTPKPLPNNIQEFLDSATDGAILFSMGSNPESADSIQKRDAIFKVFRKIKQKILCKWENESLPNQPSNVKLSKWVPQNDVLAHPNIKLFITHGGLLSIFETVFHGVPVMGMPVFGDQYSNMRIAEDFGYGISIPSAELTEEKFEYSLNEILHNPKYLENARARSKIMHDDKMKPLDKAVFWIEYILRHNGAPHLKSPALNMSWYQYLLLDILTVIILMSTVLFVFIYKIFKWYFKPNSFNVKIIKKE